VVEEETERAEETRDRAKRRRRRLRGLKKQEDTWDEETGRRGGGD
jgi:hypothetical protein